jgi:hypothetical protein
MNKLRIVVIAVILAVIAALIGVGSMTQANALVGTPGDSADNPIVVDSLDEIPAGAALTAVLNDDCSTTTNGVLTVPGSEETSHQEFRYSRDVPAVDEQAHFEWSILDRQRTFTPAQDEVSHTEFKYERTVEDYKTQYHFRKYTQTRERTYSPGTPAVASVWANFSPNKQQGTFTGPPSWPTDSRGTWHLHSQIPGGHAGPNGVYQKGSGNSSWFYRFNGTAAVPGSWGPWGAFGPWTPWVPETHTSWEDSDAPLGSPAPHGSGQNGNVQWERVWQAQFDGQTRQVENGSHTETSEWLTEPPAGDGWEQIDNRQVVDQEATPEVYGEWSLWALLTDHLLVEPTLSENTLVHEYQLVGPVRVVDSLAIEGYTEYYVLGGEPSLNEEDASWILAEQAPEGWTQFDERTVSNEDGTPEVVTYYTFNDGVECDKPEEPPVDEPPVKNPPVKHNTPAVPVSIDAGL